MGKLGWFMSDINRNIPTTCTRACGDALKWGGRQSNGHCVVCQKGGDETFIVFQVIINFIAYCAASARTEKIFSFIFFLNTWKGGKSLRTAAHIHASHSRMPCNSKIIKISVEFSPCVSSKPHHKPLLGYGAARGDACGKEGKDRKQGASHPQKPLRLIRDGEIGGSGILSLTPTRYTVTTRMILHQGGQLYEPF